MFRMPFILNSLLDKNIPLYFARTSKYDICITFEFVLCQFCAALARSL
jgi:hypothetical protein